MLEEEESCAPGMLFEGRNPLFGGDSPSLTPHFTKLLAYFLKVSLWICEELSNMFYLFIYLNKTPP